MRKKRKWLALYQDKISMANSHSIKNCAAQHQEMSHARCQKAQHFAEMAFLSMRLPAQEALEGVTGPH